MSNGLGIHKLANQPVLNENEVPDDLSCRNSGIKMHCFLMFSRPHWVGFLDSNNMKYITCMTDVTES